jgi:hypothetical protein
MKTVKLMDLKKKLARISLFLSDVNPLLLSHHPDCDIFSKHVYHIGKKKLCIGCFTYYPTIAITIILTLFFVELTITNLFVLFFISFLFFLAVVLNLLKLTKTRFLKIISKILIGIGAGFYIVAAIFLPIHIILKIMMIWQINLFGGIIAYIRIKKIEKDCLKCEFKKDWDNCPGMKHVRDKLYEHEFRKKKIL